jgi:hypothetical protein
MTILHERDRFIQPIFRQLKELQIPVRWQLCLNKPNSAVLAEVAALVPTELVSIDVFDAPFSPLERKERFMELRQWQLEQAPPTTYGVLWDDDHVLADVKEAREKLLRDYDLIYATKLFFWGDDEHFTTHIPTHRSVFFFRRLDGDRYPLDRTIHAPARIHDTGKRVVDLAAPLLDYGYLCERDRERCWADYKRCGKIDASTLAIVQEPELLPWKGPFPLRT